MEETSPNQSKELDPDPERSRTRSKLPDLQLNKIAAFVYYRQRDPICSRQRGSIPRPVLTREEDLAELGIDDAGKVAMRFTKYSEKPAYLGVSLCISKKPIKVPPDSTPELIVVHFCNLQSNPELYYLVFRTADSDQKLTETLVEMMQEKAKTAPKTDLITELLRFARESNKKISVVTLHKNDLTFQEERIYAEVGKEKPQQE